jgi:hypothetical protein
MIMNCQKENMNLYLKQSYKSTRYHIFSTKIQSFFRGQKCRRKMKYFKMLPFDIQYHILGMVRSEFHLENLINKYIIIKLIRYYWTPPTSQIQGKFISLYLVRKYIHLLKRHTIVKAQTLCFKMLLHIHDLRQRLLVNATLESISLKLFPY